MIVLFTVIVVVYVLLIASLVYGFNRVPDFKYQAQKTVTHFSIVIPFRDEAKHLPELLDSISNLDYNKTQFEILFVNDASIDTSVIIIKNHFINSDIRYQVLQNNRQSNSPKKDAITTAIKHVKHAWVITTDADCILPKSWLKTYDAFIQSTASTMIVAPVTYKPNASFLDNFQTLDFWSLQTVTIGAFGLKHPFLCNGANLAFTKTMFNTLEGYKGNDAIASGDDIFLMEKFIKNTPQTVTYLKSRDATVTTYPESSWTKLYHQRLRWASKTSNYTRLFPKLVGLIVLITNTSLIALSLLCVLGIINFYSWGILVLLKIAIDFFAIYKSAKFYATKKPLRHYIFSSLLYPIFSCTIACNATFFKYKWKGRYFNK